MKKELLILIIIINISSLIAETSIKESEYYSILSSIEFSDQDTCTIRTYPEPIVFNYEYIQEYGVPFLVSETFEKTLFLHNKYFAIASPMTVCEETFPGRTYIQLLSRNLPVSTRMLKTNFGNMGTKAFASSELTEKEYKYEVKNLLTPLDNPWVEGAEGNGIGEIIELIWEKQEVYEEGVAVISICSGFISYEKPYLYEFNSRPKKIEIRDIENDLNMSYILEDTPNPQFIELEEPTNHIEIKIIEAYPGSKWDDLCIDYIVGIPKYAWEE